MQVDKIDEKELKKIREDANYAIFKLVFAVSAESKNRSGQYARPQEMISAMLEVCVKQVNELKQLQHDPLTIEYYDDIISIISKLQVIK